MTTFTNFVPSLVAPFQFSATLDGNPYNVIVTWNLFGRRYYVNVYALDGTLVVSEAMVGSPTGISLSALSWANGVATAKTAEPHGYKIGRVISLTISGTTPAAYSGLVEATITGPSTFTYALAANPGAAVAPFGTAAYNINLVGGYFATSSLVYRTQSNQFEVSP